MQPQPIPPPGPDTLPPGLIAHVSAMIVYADLATQPTASPPEVRLYLGRIAQLSGDLRSALYGDIVAAA